MYSTSAGSLQLNRKNSHKKRYVHVNTKLTYFHINDIYIKKKRLEPDKKKSPPGKYKDGCLEKGSRVSWL